MSINLTDELLAKTKKGKIASAKQVFLEGDQENLQQIGDKTHQLEDSIKDITVTGGASTANAVSYNNETSGMTSVTAQGAIDELAAKNATKAENAEVIAELEKKFDKESILQESGDAEDKVMSQKATTTAIADETTRAKAAEEAIIFDVSVYNNGAVFESLQALLSSSGLSTLIPTSVRHGGMSIRFIQGSKQSSDNKYMQFRYMGTATNDATFTNIANWQKNGRSSKTIIVAAYDSSEEAKTSADIVANSESSGITAINTAIASLTDGGRVYLLQGTYSGTNPVEINVSNILLEGESFNAYIKRTGSLAYNPVLVGSSVTGTIVQTIKFDYIPNVYHKNIRVDGLYNSSSENIITIAASDSPDRIKTNAEYICGGSEDNIIINQALNTIASIGGTVKLCAGTYILHSPLYFVGSNSVLIGDFGATKITYDDTYTGGNNVVITSNNSQNCRVIGIDFGAKFLSLDNSGSGIAYQCTYGSKYNTFSELENQLALNTYTYLIAASDAPTKFKKLADFICDGVDDNIEINNCITYLRNNNKTGVIQLSPGTFNFTSGGVIQITTSGIEIRGCGYSTTITRTNPLVLEILNNATNNIVRGINFGTHTVDVKSQGSAYVYDCWIGGKYYHEYTRQDGTIFIHPSQGIAGINSAITSMGNNGGKILLAEGTYEGTNGIAFTGKNVTIEGQGVKTIIKRSSGNDVFADAGAANNILRNISLYNRFQQNGEYPFERYRMEDVWYKGTLINQSVPSNVIINVGNSFFFKTVSEPYAKITSSNWVYSNRFEIHIHGHVIQDEELWCDKPVSIIGHNALLEFRGGLGIKATFSGIGSTYTSNMYGWIPIVIKDIHFIKTGCFNYWNDACVSITGTNWRFENCIFENASFSPSPFDNSTQDVGDEDHNGCRRHGVGITINSYGIDCKTEFHGCIAIASPYGFQSCRGWYFMTGSPRLYNCVGYGGGIGEFGHGIVCHEASDAMLFNFVSYAGRNSYRQAAGIRYQASGKNNLVNCIGYGSYGVQLKSNGVPYSALHTRCVEVGITDESFFYDGTTVNYNGLTIKKTDDGYNSARLALGNAIQPSDLELVNLGGSTEESFGISLWNHNGTPILENCKGYAGHGTNSEGIIIQSLSSPLVKGGYFGWERQTFIQNIIKDTNGYCTFNIPSSILNIYVPYIIKNIGITIRGNIYASRHLLFHLETDEATPQVIINGYDMYNKTSIGTPTVARVKVPAGVGLKAYITENDSVVTNYTDSYFYIMGTFVANPTGGKAGSIREYSYPQIVGALFESENDGLGIYTTSTEYLVDRCTIESNENAIVTNKTNLKVYDSAIRGTVDSGITFAEKTFINSSSNYSI